MSRELRPHDAALIAVLREAVAAAVPEIVVASDRYRPVQGFPRYMIGETGTVFSGVRACRILRQTVSPQGYPYVSLMDDAGRARKCLVHRLVAVAFIDNPLGLAVVNHRNGIKSDPRAENLEWVSYSENNDHARITKLSTAIGETHYAAKLSDAAIFEIRQLGGAGLLHRQIAERFGVRRQHITKILNGQSRAGGVR